MERRSHLMHSARGDGMLESFDAFRQRRWKVGVISCVLAEEMECGSHVMHSARGDGMLESFDAFRQRRWNVEVI